MKIEVQIKRAVDVVETPRVQQLLGIFDVPPSKRSEQSWHHKLDLPDAWNVGVIVGPSGAGKTTLAREAFGKELVSGWGWPAKKSILDGFPKSMGIRDITGLLSSVGFSSPPSWIRPFSVLSNGEQFRVTVARTLAEQPDLAVVDEFTSVVDRTVAQIGSAAIAKTVRRRGQKFVAVTCHYDVVDWLEPDWVYEPHTGTLTLSREGLWRRPTIQLEVVRVHSSAWQLFKRHHYLDSQISSFAKYFVGFVGGQPVAFTSAMSFAHPTRPGWREHRTVCLPDFQGVGIGNAMADFVAGMFRAKGKPYRSTTSHPAMIKYRVKSPLWKMTRRPGFAANSPNSGSQKDPAGRRVKIRDSFGRLTAAFEYVGPANATAAKAFGLLDGPSWKLTAKRYQTAQASPAPQTVLSA
jgi:hypothetical protein